MKAAAAERKASQKQEDLDKALAEAIAKLPGDERQMAETIDTIVRQHAPMLASKTYYGMPGWARDGKVCVFMQPASKFKVRYCTIGFDPISNLDDGDMWPTSFAILKIGPAEETQDHRPGEEGRVVEADRARSASALRRCQRPNPRFGRSVASSSRRSRMFGDATTGRAYRTIVPLAVRCRSGVAIAAPEQSVGVRGCKLGLSDPLWNADPVLGQIESAHSG